MSKFFLRFSSLLLVILVAFSACMGGDDAEDTSEDSSEEVTEEGAISELPDLPEGCAPKNTITFNSPETGEVNLANDTSYYIASVDYWGMLIFANFDVDYVDPYLAPLEGGQFFVGVNLKNENDAPIGTDLFEYKDAEEALSRIIGIDTSMADLSGGISDDNAQVAFNYFGEDYVCGEITAENETSSLMGTFMVPNMQELSE